MAATAEIHTVPQLVAGYRARIAQDPDLFDGDTDVVLWLIEATTARDWTPSEIARAAGITTNAARDIVATLTADGDVVGNDRGARTRYSSRRR